MKTLLCFAFWVGATAAAHAQILPVPNARNPDWILDNTTLGSRPSRPDSAPGSRDRMPIADPSRQGGVSAMPNALTKSISSVGNRHYYWDAARQLSYEWQSRPNQVAPDSLVKVRQQATGATFTYRKRPKAEQAYPRKLN
jgi:hypothetical protein